MPKADTAVKWFHSDMPNAPVCRGQAGALLELLDACLIHGFSTRTPDSITVADGVATVALSAGNPYEKHAVIKIAGGSIAELNAEWRVASAGPSSLTFLCPGLADGVASGASIVRAPAGWTKPFSDGNVAVYQSADPASTQLYLRVDDADARYTRVRGYEHMTSASAGTGPFPTAAQWAVGVTWLKSTTADATPRAWSVFADGSIFYVYLATAGETRPSVVAFGDLVSARNADSYHCIIAGDAQTASPSSPGVSAGFITSNATLGCYIARLADQTTQSSLFARDSIRVRAGFSGYGSVIGRGAGSFDLTALRAVFANDGNDVSDRIRGIVPGLYEPLGPYFEGITPVIFDGAGAYAGRAYAGLKVATLNGTGAVAFDLTGPWR